MAGKQTTTTKPKGSLDDRLTQFQNEIALDADITTSQREQANEDMRFIHEPGGMWENFLNDSNASNSSATERVRLQFDLVSEYRDRFIGNYNQNRIGVEFKPDDSATSDVDAALLNGIYRTDYRQFAGKIAVDNAVDEVADAGYGCLKISTKFEDESNPENEDQRTEFRPIHNAFNTVIWDSNAKWINKRDAMRCVELVEYNTREAFEAEYPGKDPVSAWQPRNDLTLSTNNKTPDIIYIANRYDIIRKKETVFVYNNLQSDEVEVFFEDDHELIKDELKADEFRVFVRERKVIRQTVEKSVFSGAEWLEKPRRIAGKYIPIIPFYGYRGFVGGVEWYKGLVRGLKDANRVFNMQVSQIAEQAASGNDNKPIFDPEQMEGGLDKFWADKVNLSWLPVHALRDKEGNVINTGPQAWSQPAQLDQNTAALMQIIPQFIQATTGGAPQDTLDPDASGKAIQAILKRENLKTQPIMDNIANSIEWLGEVWQSIATEIYDSKRMVKVTGRDGTEGVKQLFEVVIDEETGRMVEGNTIRGKKFKAYSDVGPAFESQREAAVEESKAMFELFAKAPGGEKYLPPLMAMIIENSAGTNLGPLKDINRKDMIMLGMVKPETEEEKQMLAQAQEPQPDPQQEAISAFANQANAEAVKFEAEARNQDSDSLDNIASAEKKAAETRKIQVETELAQMDSEVGRVKSLLEIRDQQFKRAQALPFN